MVYRRTKQNESYNSILEIAPGTFNKLETMINDVIGKIDEMNSVQHMWENSIGIIDLYTEKQRGIKC